jgi:hypothetical protein
MNENFRPSHMAWIGLFFYVFGVDILLIRKKKSHGEPYCSMSETFETMLEHPVKKWPVTISWIFLTIHLFQTLIPKKISWIKKIDPIKWIIKLIEVKNERYKTINS